MRINSSHGKILIVGVLILLTVIINIANAPMKIKISSNDIETKEEVTRDKINSSHIPKNTNNIAHTFNIHSDNTSPLLSNISLSDVYIYHRDAENLIALKEEAGISIIVFTNKSILFYNYSKSYVIDVLDFDHGYLGNDELNEKLITLSNKSINFFTSDGECYKRLDIEFYWSNISLTGESITLWRSNDSLIKVLSDNGSILLSGRIVNLMDLNGANISYYGSILIRDITYYYSSILLLIRYNLSGSLTDSIAVLEWEMGLNKDLTAIVIDNQLPMTIYSHTFGSWHHEKSLFTLLKNKTKGYEIRIYAGLKGKNESIQIDSSLSDLVINSIDIDSVDDWNNDNVSEVVISNGTHVGVLVSNGTGIIKKIINKGIESFSNEKFVTYNESSILILNESLYVTQRYDVSSGVIVDVFNSSNKLIALTSTGSLMELNPSSKLSVERKITSFNYRGYSYSYNALAVYTTSEVLAEWVGETRYLLRYIDASINKTEISQQAVSVFLTNGTLLLYNKNGEIIYKTTNPNITLATANENASLIFLALKNGTLHENNTGNRLAIERASPIFLDLFNNNLVYVVSRVQVGPIINITLLKINPWNLNIEESFSILLNMGGYPNTELLYYGYSIALNDINNNNIIDIAIGIYGEISAYGGALYKNAFNLSIIKDLSEISYKIDVSPNIKSSPIGFRYVIYPFNDSFLYANSSSTDFYLIVGSNSVRKISFIGEKALSASNHVLFTNKTIRIFYNNSFLYNISSIQNVTIAVSILKNGSLLSNFIDYNGVIRLRELTGLEDYYSPLLIDIRSPKLLSGNTLISNSNNISFEFSFSDDVCLKNYSISIDSKYNASGNITGSHTSVSVKVITDLMDGSYRVEVTIFDLAERSSLYVFDLIIDSEPPNIRVNYSDIYNSTSISFTINITDNNYDFTDIYVDGKYYSRCSQNSAVITVNDLLQGDHEIELIAFDKAGNYNRSQFSFIIDLEAPIIRMHDLINNSYTSNQYINVSFNVSDNYNLAHLMITLNNTIILDEKLRTNETAINQKIKLLEGVNVIIIKATDEAKLIRVIKIVIHLDTKEPSIDLIARKINGTTIELEINVTDNLELEEVIIYVDGSEVGKYNKSLIKLNISLVEGIHNITVSARDIVGNVNTRELSVIIDITPPEIELISPKNDTMYNENLVELNLTVKENVEISVISIYVDNKLILSANNTNIKYLMELSEGTHNITILAIDINGNKARLCVIITIDTTPPKLEIINPVNGSIINSYRFNLTISFSDNYGVSRIIVFLNDSVLYNTSELIDSFRIKVNQNGVYKVRVVIIDNAGNSAVDTIIININVKNETETTGEHSMSEAILALVIGMSGALIGILYVYLRKRIVR